MQISNLKIKSKNSKLILFYRITAVIIFIILLPLFFVLYLLVKLTSKGPFIFKQKRMGKAKKKFTLYKIRTMVANAESLKPKVYGLNEADGPVFKIRNDPRHTKIGRILARTALDELPQLVNIIKGEMSFVGPRPLPVDEAKKIPKKYHKRFSVLPGMTSPWIVGGAHKLKFDQWMKLDLEYVKNQSTWLDLKILTETLIVITRTINK